MPPNLRRIARRIAVMTSGGDAAGMNAAVRAVVRAAAARGWQTLGVRDGFLGLVEGRSAPLGPRDVGNILQHGGTMLGSARLPTFAQRRVRARAVAHLAERGVNALVVIGGNGSQAGALALAQMGVPTVGIASTIDNDLVGSDVCLGVDTALNVALEAIDRLKVTAASHRRAFLVEVMGRDCGYLALEAGLAGGAEAIVIPERERTPASVMAAIRAAWLRGKRSAIVVVAEGARHPTDALMAYAKRHEKSLGFELRATRLGHVQRGGTPGAFDRILAARLGGGAVAALARGERGVLVGIKQGRVVTTPLRQVVAARKPLDVRLLELADTLAM